MVDPSLLLEGGNFLVTFYLAVELATIKRALLDYEEIQLRKPPIYELFNIAVKR